MTALNDASRDAYEGQEVLIELPDNSDNCTFIVNGHYECGANEGKRHLDETKPFLSPKPIRTTLEEESDPELEPESSTHLLQQSGPFFQSPTQKKPQPQQRPLGTGQCAVQYSTSNAAKKYRTCTPVLWLLLCVVTVVTSLCLALHLAKGIECEGPPSWWWQGATFYEVFPSSFQDSDSDGFGDMRGLTRRLDYIQNLSVTAVRLSSIFSALDYPLEYEHVIDFANIDPHLGGMGDFQEFVRELHSREMRLVLDINPSLTSDQHSWAAHWLLRRKGPFEHFYVNITEEEGEEPPLDPNPDYSEVTWASSHRTFGSHLYLNWSNSLLQEEMRHVLEFWIEQGVDGFYIKHLKNLRIADRTHIAEIIGQWRAALNVPNNSSGRIALMVSQADIEYLETILDPVAFSSIAAKVDLVEAAIGIRNSSEVCVAEEVNRLMRYWTRLVVPPTVVWQLGSVETRRLASRIGSEMNFAGLFLLAILPGSFSVFYGDEIGLKDTFDLITRKVYRGGFLVPMAWTSEKGAGFTSSSGGAWLPLHPESTVVNVESQSERVELFKQLVELKGSGQYWSLARPRPSQSDALKEYRLYQNHCGLVVVKMLHKSGIFFANYGWENVKLSSHNCDNKISSLIHFETLVPSLATNSSLIGRPTEWVELSLKPGDSLFGSIIT